MAEYTLKKVKQYDGREGPGFSAEIYRNGKFAGNVVDAGNGGSFSIYMTRYERKLFLDTVAEWQVKRNAPDMLEPSDRYLNELLELHRMRKAVRRIVTKNGAKLKEMKEASARIARKNVLPLNNWYAVVKQGTDGVYALTGEYAFSATPDGVPGFWIPL